MNRPDRFVQGIWMVKNLEKLYLNIVWGLTVIDICSLCKHLYSVRLNVDIGLTGDDLLRLIESAENFNSLSIYKFHFPNYTDAGLPIIVNNPIDVDVFEEMVKLVAARSKETHLEIRLDRRIYTINVPDELARAHKKAITLKYL